MMEERSLGRRVTSREVANVAGVDRSSVSLVVNDPETRRVGADAKRRIQAAVHALGYVPDRAAKQLRGGVSRTVLLSYPSWMVGPTFDLFIEGLSDAAEAADLLFLIHGSSSSTGLAAARDWAAVGPRIFIGEHRRIDAEGIALLFRSGTKVVLLAGDGVEQPGALTIPLNAHEPGRMAAAHLVERGYRQLVVAVPSDPRHAFAVNARIGSFVQEADRLGVASRIVRFGEADDSLTLALEEIMSVGGRVGLFAHNDRYAVPLLGIARERGIDVPGRLGVVALDNILAAGSATPQLTSISYDPRQFGEAILQYALHGQEGTSAAPGPLFRLTIRQSS